MSFPSLLPARDYLSRTRLPGAHLPLLLSVVVAIACSESERPRSAVLITIDTLRADHVGSYRQAAATKSATPHIDALAGRGVLFERAAAPMGLTRPSHFSMLTSLYPREHGVLNNAIALPDDVRTLPEMLREADYRTAAFVSVVLLGPNSGAGQGFETLVHPTKPRERSAGSTVDGALEWISSLSNSEAFFLWVHLFDPHLPYAPPAEFRPAAAAGQDTTVSLDWPEFISSASANGGDIPASVLSRARSLYAAEVNYADRELGRLLEGLALHGRAADTVIVFTADHGEAFGHGSYFEHADSLFDGTVAIPLIVAGDEPLVGGVRVSSQVSSVDIAPTLLTALSLPVPAGFSGSPLQERLVRGGEADSQEHFVLIQHPFYQKSIARHRSRKRAPIQSVAGDPVETLLVDAERVGVVSEEWKLLRTGEQFELYHRPSGESENLAATNPSELARLRGELERLLEAHPLRLIDERAINDELLEALRALGYTH